MGRYAAYLFPTAAQLPTSLTRCFIVATHGALVLGEPDVPNPAEVSPKRNVAGLLRRQGIELVGAGCQRRSGGRGRAGGDMAFLVAAEMLTVARSFRVTL